MLQISIFNHIIIVDGGIQVYSCLEIKPKINVEDVKDPKFKVGVKISMFPMKIQEYASLIDCQRRLTPDKIHQV